MTNYSYNFNPQEFPESARIYESFFPSEKTASVEKTATEESKVVNYITSKMADKPWEQVQDVLIGVGLTMDDLAHNGQPIIADDIIKNLNF